MARDAAEKKRADKNASQASYAIGYDLSKHKEIKEDPAYRKKFEGYYSKTKKTMPKAERMKLEADVDKKYTKKEPTVADYRKKK